MTRGDVTKKIQLGLGACVLVAMIGGCATQVSTEAKALEVGPSGLPDLSQYRIATVLPFEDACKKPIPRSVGKRFADDVRDRLEVDFGPIFTEVRAGPPLGTPDELIVTGQITKYDKGNRFARAMLIGLGPASLKGRLILKDGGDQHVLLTANFDKLWAWGGMVGASKGIEDMMTEVAASASATVAKAKGWQPQKGK